MTRGLQIAAGVGLVIAAVVTWTMVPPFPPPAPLLNYSAQSLTTVLGAPTASGHTADSVSWVQARGFVVWTLEAEWNSTPALPTSHPTLVSRSFRIRGTRLVVPVDAAMAAREAAADRSKGVR